MKVVGGHQDIWNSVCVNPDGSIGANERVVDWGEAGDSEGLIYSSLAFNNNSNQWEDAVAVLHLVPAQVMTPDGTIAPNPRGRTIVGYKQLVRDEPSNLPFQVDVEWGNVGFPGDDGQLIAYGKTWSNAYNQWGFSELHLYLA